MPSDTAQNTRQNRRHPWLSRLDDLLDQTVLFGYDRVGYHLRQPLWDASETEVNLKGKVCLVTGANSGLGLATATGLAERGATVIMACRSLERGEAARQQVIQATGNQQVFVEALDVGLMQSVRDFATRLDWPAIDVLIHNAGALLNERQQTSEGFEVTLATHVLGPYLLTNLLLPRLHGARIILVASGGMYMAALHPEDLQFQQRPYHGATAYAEAKRGQVLLNKLWARAFAERGILVNAMHPGWADTQGVKDSLPLFRAVTQLILRNPEEGADTTIWLAANPNLRVSGEFFCDRRARGIYRSHQTRNSPSEIESWWQQIGELTHCPRPFPYRLVP
jgi:dehydrogenase/reductase SDR family protein 12